MAKRYYKDLKIIGQFFCLYNISQTAKCIVYAYQGNTYFKPRYKATKGIQICAINNMVPCQPLKIGVIAGYQEI